MSRLPRRLIAAVSAAAARLRAQAAAAVAFVRRRRLATAVSAMAAAGLAAGLALAFTSGAPPIRPVAVAHLAARPKPRPHPRTPLLSPFTGEPVKKLGPVLVAKIDNIVYARPQTGLQSADIVYVLPVEGGLSRFEAVFSSHFPKVIGPVRSAREDDLELLRQFGRPAFAFSGATPELLPVVEHARIVDLYSGLVGGYFRSSDRIAPYNLYANTSQLLAEARGASTAHDIGFRFGPPPAGGRPTTSYPVSYPAAAFTFRWSAKDGRWLVWMDGAPALATEGGQLGGATVVIQDTVITTSRFLEYGSRPPYAVSIGSGRAVVLRNGMAYTVHWSRPRLDGGTTFTLPSGKRMTFAPGQVWVVFAGAWP
jgi:Protein of unknown function (DUF3048) N-terminal domain/Protein of unknown function (DUF3048) C-terminal domain